MDPRQRAGFQLHDHLERFVQYLCTVRVAHLPLLVMSPSSDRVEPAPSDVHKTISSFWRAVCTVSQHMLRWNLESDTTFCPREVESMIEGQTVHYFVSTPEVAFHFFIQNLFYNNNHCRKKEHCSEHPQPQIFLR